MQVDSSARRAVRQAIIAWDPEDLIEGGAPMDEYDHEIEDVLAAFPACETEGDLVEAIEGVFSASFASVYTGRCNTVAHDIMVQLFLGS